MKVGDQVEVVGKIYDDGTGPKPGAVGTIVGISMYYYVKLPGCRSITDGWPFYKDEIRPIESEANEWEGNLELT